MALALQSLLLDDRVEEGRGAPSGHGRVRVHAAKGKVSGPRLQERAAGLGVLRMLAVAEHLLATDLEGEEVHRPVVRVRHLVVLDRTLVKVRIHVPPEDGVGEGVGQREVEGQLVALQSFLLDDRVEERRGAPSGQTEALVEDREGADVKAPEASLRVLLDVVAPCPPSRRLLQTLPCLENGQLQV